MSFLFLPRNEKKAWREEVRVFLPGWGFDGWSAFLFPPLVNGDLIIPDGLLTPEVMSELNSFLEERGIRKINLIGWSMGANFALEYALKYSGAISSLSLAAMRTFWPSRDIKEIRRGLFADPGQFMTGFYRKCFLGSRPVYRKFIAEFQEKYLTDLKIDDLLEGLNYLENYRFEPASFPAGIEVKIFHGGKDIVAPVAERPNMAGASETLLPKAGHAVLSGNGIII